MTCGSLIFCNLIASPPLNLYAGTVGISGFTQGHISPGTGIRFGEPIRTAVSHSGAVFVLENTNFAIRKLSSSGG